MEAFIVIDKNPDGVESHLQIVNTHGSIKFDEKKNNELIESLYSPHKIVKKLIGPIRPVGETNEDNQRLENLKAMCQLMDDIHTQIDAVAYEFRNRHESSMSEAGKYASKFLTTLGIEE